MTDLTERHIEALEEMQFTNKIYPRHNEAAKWAITTLREQEEVLNSFREVMTNENLKTRQELQARITELEDERMDTAMLDQYRIWYAKEEAKVKRLDAALGEISEGG
jgi:hypothetical protein